MMKHFIFTISTLFLLCNCSLVKPVKQKGNYLSHQGECRLKNSDLLKVEHPLYPTKALKIQQEGWVILKFDLRNGKPENIRLVDSSPKGFFEKAATDSLKNSLYVPTLNKEGCLSIREFKLN